MTNPARLAISVDLEPNKDGTMDGVRDAMDWFDRTVPRGTIFATHRIATELPDLVADLQKNHEIGAHVHPQEFGHDHDLLARLSTERQSEVIYATRQAIAAALDTEIEDIRAFRAGRHSASGETIEVLRQQGFDVDASVNVRFGENLPDCVAQRNKPFEWDGIVEVPTTYARLPIMSKCGLRAVLAGELTATASALRTDSWLCSGEEAMQYLFATSEFVSMYMHPYDATTHHLDLNNSGPVFRERFERLIDACMTSECIIVDICNVEPTEQHR